MDVTITLDCNNNCLFCPRQRYLSLIASGSDKELYRDIKKTRAVSDKIVLSGGEVTLKQDICDIISFCKKEGFREIGIISNARNLRKVALAETLIKSGVSDFALSLYSIKPGIHDNITGVKGSCAQTKKGIKNMLGLSERYGFGLRINLLLNFWNKYDIFNTLRVLISWGVKNFIVAEQIMVDKKPHLSLQEIRGFLEKAQDLEIKGAYLCLRGFVPCLLKSWPSSFIKDKIVKTADPRIIMENYVVDTLVKNRDRKERYLNKFKDNFSKFPRCKKCVFFKRCPGLQKKYFSHEQ